MGFGCEAAMALAWLVAMAPPVAAQGAVSYSPPTPLAPQAEPFPFPYLDGELSQSYLMNLPSDVLNTLIKDAKLLKTGKVSGSYKDDKGTTWWQPKKEKRRFSLEQMIEVIGRLDFPDGMPKDIVGAEYWVQIRRGDDDGGFHYDKDESAASNKQRMIFPSMSTITYLTDGGAPTVILNQTTNQFGNDEVPAVPSEGYLSFPMAGKHLHFNGHAQHGVSGPVCQENCGGDRIVLLVNWWDHTPEPPNCQRMTDSLIQELGFTRFAKPVFKEIKSTIQEKSEQVVPVESESLRASASTEVVSISLPPVDVLELTIPEKYANSNGKTVHFALPPSKSTILGVIDPHKRTQVAHIQYSTIPTMFAFVDGNNAAGVASVLRPIQSALWAGGVVRQHMEMYLAYTDQCAHLMNKFGIKPAKSQPLPFIVLQQPARQGQQNAFSVMRGVFSAKALKKFLVKEGVPVPGGDGEGSDETGLVGAANGAEGCIEEFDLLAQKFSAAGNPMERASAADAMQRQADLIGQVVASGDEAHYERAKYYAKTMERIQAKGKKWVGKETARLDRMLAEGKLSAEKKQSMIERKNILAVFADRN